MFFAELCRNEHINGDRHRSCAELTARAFGSSFEEWTAACPPLPIAPLWRNVPDRVLLAPKAAHNRRMFLGGNICLTFARLQ
jgi:hypothetical protein